MGEVRRTGKKVRKWEGERNKTGEGRMITEEAKETKKGVRREREERSERRKAEK